MNNDNDAELLADVGAVDKNGMGEKIRVRVLKWRGHACIDLRVFVSSEDGAKATRKGLAVPVAKAAEVLTLLQAAAVEASRLGLVSFQPSQSQGRQSREMRRETRQGEKSSEARRMNDGGMPADEIAEQLGVSRATVYRWLKDAPILGVDAPHRSPG